MPVQLRAAGTKLLPGTGHGVAGDSHPLPWPPWGAQHPLGLWVFLLQKCSNPSALEGVWVPLPAFNKSVSLLGICISYPKKAAFLCPLNSPPSLPVPLKQKFLFPGGVGVFISCCCFSSALCAVLVGSAALPHPEGTAARLCPALGSIQHPPWGCAGRPPPPRLLQRESSGPSCAFLSCRKREVAQASPYFCHENCTLRLAAGGARRVRAEESVCHGAGCKTTTKKKKRQKNRLTPLLPSLKLFPLSLRACGGFAEIHCANGEKSARFWPRDGEGQVRGAALCRQGKEISWR